jgi:hypothetical protein
LIGSSLALIAALATVGRARTLDRVVASVGQTAITQSDIEQEYRFERFMEGLDPVGSPGAPARRVIVRRLISRTLLMEDLKDSGVTLKPSAESTRRALAEIRKRFGSPARYQSALGALGMSEEQVLKRLEAYQQTLEYIDRRFQPVTPPSPAEVHAYYESSFVPEYRRLHQKPPPPLVQVEAPIREILLQKKLDQRLNEWLKEMRSTKRVRIHDE